MEVNSDMTMGEMVEEIYKSLTTGVTHATKIGTLTGDGTINIASKYPSYKQFTVENFLIVITNVPDTWSTASKLQATYSIHAVGAVPRKTYDASTGTLTVTGLQQNIYVTHESWGAVIGCSQTFTADIYAI